MAVSDVNDLVSVSISIQQSLQSFSSQQQQLTPTASSGQSSTIASDAVEVSLSIEAKLQLAAQQGVTPSSSEAAQAAASPPALGGYHGLRHLERQKANFDSIDTSGDGTLSLDELKAAQSSRQADGRKTPFLDRLISSFDQSDTDSSGGISFAEAHPKEAAYVQQLFGFTSGQTAPTSVSQNPSPEVTVQA
ncbi:MAG: EF-hand domain-containing protein [Bdellovibrionota bacterium]